MARIHFLGFCLFLISACVTVTEDNEAPTPETAVPAAAAELQSASNPFIESLTRESNELNKRNDRIPGKEEIKSLQNANYQFKSGCVSAIVNLQLATCNLQYSFLFSAPSAPSCKKLTLPVGR